MGSGWPFPLATESSPHGRAEEASRSRGPSHWSKVLLLLDKEEFPLANLKLGPLWVVGYTVGFARFCLLPSALNQQPTAGRWPSPPGWGLLSARVGSFHSPRPSLAPFSSCLPGTVQLGVRVEGVGIWL